MNWNQEYFESDFDYDDDYSDDEYYDHDYSDDEYSDDKYLDDKYSDDEYSDDEYSHLTNPKSVLHDVMANVIKMDDEDTKKRVRIIEEVVKDTLILKMKETDPLFDNLFKEINHSGSYYDGLRCKKADEFDLNVVLSIPSFQRQDFSFDTNEVRPGYCKVSFKVDDRFPMTDVQTSFLKVLTERTPTSKPFSIHYLLRSKLHKWFRRVLKRAKSCTYNHPDVHPVKISTKGTAWTLKIRLKCDNSIIDVDLVPTFAFKCEDLLDCNIIKQKIKENNWSDETFYIIPKKTKRYRRRRSGRFWRLSFYDIERKVMRKQPTSKNIIRLLKVLFDSKHSSKKLSSYALKTVVLRLIEERNSKLDWSHQNIEELFIRALKFLKIGLERGRISEIFHHQTDVLNMDLRSSRQLSRRLGRVLKQLHASKNRTNCRKVWGKFFDLET